MMEAKLLRQRLEYGETVFGTMLSEIYVPNIVRLLQGCGFSFLILDGEHGYFDLTQMANIIAVADGIGLPIIVRVASPEKGRLTKIMDMGASGVLLSNTETVEDARRLVDACMYAPVGNRGVSTFRAHTNYHPGDLECTMRAANARNLIICQIESEGAAERAKDLLAVPGVSGAMVGPNDMSQHMGILGQYAHPRMVRALRLVSEAAAANEKWSGVITGNAGLIRQCRELGMTCFSAGSELNMLASGGKKTMEMLRQQTARDLEDASDGKAD